MSYKHDFVDKYPYLTYTNEPSKSYADVFGVYADNDNAADDEGGGGGADLGEIYGDIYYFYNECPSVGDGWNDVDLSSLMASSIGVGASPLFNYPAEDNASLEFTNIAEGATVKTFWFYSDQMADFGGVYTLTIKTDGRDLTVGAVVDLNITATVETETLEDETTATRYVFTVPTKPVAADIPLAEGETVYAAYNCVCFIPEGE